MQMKTNECECMETAAAPSSRTASRRTGRRLSRPRAAPPASTSRGWPHSRFARPSVRGAPDSRRESVRLLLEQRCDRALPCRPRTPRHAGAARPGCPPPGRVRSQDSSATPYDVFGDIGAIFGSLDGERLSFPGVWRRKHQTQHILKQQMDEQIHIQSLFVYSDSRPEPHV